jgi:hypothetical protein
MGNRLVRVTYISMYASSVRGWTGDPTCAIPGTTPSPTSNQNWLNQSIVNGTNSAIFNYQNTSIGGWMCRSFQGNIGFQPQKVGNQRAYLKLNDNDYRRLSLDYDFASLPGGASCQINVSSSTGAKSDQSRKSTR